jgi:hypothetical protein
MKKNPQKRTKSASVAEPGKTPKINGQGGKDAAGTDFPVVGIGASAGGLAAFEAFFPLCLQVSATVEQCKTSGTIPYKKTLQKRQDHNCNYPFIGSA